MTVLPTMRPLTLVLIALLAAACAWLWHQVGGHEVVDHLDPRLAARLGLLVATFDGPDAERVHLPIGLEPVVTGLSEVTDIQFPPGHPGAMVVLQKKGQAVWVDLADGQVRPWFSVDVNHRSELGLLGLAFAPDFASSGRFFVHASPAGEPLSGRVDAWRADPAAPSAPPVREHPILVVEQPYPNHDGGQLAFGPDGMLYVGFGDGGARDDRARQAQDPSTWLGSMLRLDVSATSAAEPYRVPPDNPVPAGTAFGPAARPEVWAIGLRNPWRFSFDPLGRLVTGDVGQDRWEEVSLVPAGGNLGWPIKEGRACYRAGAAAPEERCGEDTVDPVHVYGRDEGVSITGGYVVTGSRVPALTGSYVFGDFVSGRLWALTLPDRAGQPAAPPRALGRWPLQPSTFGRDLAGDLYVGAFAGTVYRVVAVDGGAR